MTDAALAWLKDKLWRSANVSLIFIAFAATGGDLSIGVGAATNVSIGRNADPTYAEPVFFGDIRYEWTIKPDRIRGEVFLMHISSIPDDDDNNGDNYAGFIFRFK